MNKKLKDYKIVQSSPSNTRAITLFLRKSWLDSYVGIQPNVTSEWINSNFDRNMSEEKVNEHKKMYERYRNNPEQYFSKQVISSEGELLGFINGSKDNGYQELLGLYVAQEQKGSDLAHEIMSQLNEWLDLSSDVTLWVADGNARAISFYNKYGYEIIDGSQKPHKKDSPLTIVKMIRKGDK